jgi:tRNA(Leu) C34 or U34 (ribose-2'-O)-methylase TrmL
VRLALYQPDIPQNTGTMLRMAACLGVSVDIVEPAGFDAPTATSAAPLSTTSMRST